MKWHKFKQYIKDYPWLLDIIDPYPLLRKWDKERNVFVDLPGRISNLRDEVRSEIDYIAFRTEKTLPDLNIPQGTVAVWRSEDHSLYDDDFPFPHKGEFWSIVWQLPNGRIGIDVHEGGNTLGNTMCSIIGSDGTICEFLVKYTYFKLSEDVPHKVMIDIFPVPVRLFAKPKIQRQVNPHEAAAYHAYVTGGEMPPIIPSLR